MNKTTMAKICPCGSDKKFDRCCGRFLIDNKQAKTAEQLMRSRFTAYALGGYGDYLMSTWHHAESNGLSSALLDVSESKWVKLEVLDKSQKGDNAIVEFKAHHLDTSGQKGLLHERSEFIRINGRWLYVEGEIFS